MVLHGLNDVQLGRITTNLNPFNDLNSVRAGSGMRPILNSRSVKLGLLNIIGMEQNLRKWSEQFEPGGTNDRGGNSDLPWSLGGILRGFKWTTRVAECGARSDDLWNPQQNGSEWEQSCVGLEVIGDTNWSLGNIFKMTKSLGPNRVHRQTKRCQDHDGWYFYCWPIFPPLAPRLVLGMVRN